MHDAPPNPPPPAFRPPEQPTLQTTQPELNELFGFMAEAELRFESLRMRIEDRRLTAHGWERESHDIWLRHPRQAKVVSTRGDMGDRDFDVWVSDGAHVRTFDAKGNTATLRRLPAAPLGADDPELPPFARIYQPVTALPAESLADTFIHPNGLCRNVLNTGTISRRGTAQIAGREAILLRCDHPRTSHVLTDRPDHWLEVGVDLQTGLLVLLAEHVAEQMTRHAQVASIGLDDPVNEDAFKLHLSADTRTLY